MRRFLLSQLGFLLAATSALADPGQVLSSFLAPAALPEGVAFDGTSLYVSAWRTRLIYRLDAQSGAVLESFPFPSLYPRDLAWDGAGFWAVSGAPREPTTLYHLDARLRPRASFVLAGLALGFGCAWDGQSVWVSDWAGNRLHRVNPLSGRIERSLPSPGPNPSGLAYDGRRLWVACMGDDRIVQVDPMTGAPERSFAAPAQNPTGLACAGGNLWSLDSLEGRVYLLKGTGPTNVEGTTWGSIKAAFR